LSFKIVKEIARVKKVGTKSTYWKLQEVEVYGKPGIDVREHFVRADGSEQYTTKGITVPMDSFADLMSGFRDVYEEYRDRM
jgi:hypothetical protein